MRTRRINTILYFVIAILAMLTAIVLYLDFQLLIENQIKNDYPYAGKEKEVRYASNSSECFQDIMYSERLDDLTEEAKMYLISSDLRDMYPDLNWDKLEYVDVFYADSITNNDDERTLDDENALAMYLYQTNEIGVNFEMEEDRDSFVINVLLHELSHVLTVNEENEGQQLLEPLAEYMANYVTDEFGLEWFPSAYQKDLDYYYKLYNVFGDDLVNLISDNELEDRIDGMNYDGSYNIMNNSMIELGNQNKYESEYIHNELVIEDILSHTVSKCSDIKTKDYYVNVQLEEEELPEEDKQILTSIAYGYEE